MGCYEYVCHPPPAPLDGSRHMAGWNRIERNKLKRGELSIDFAIMQITGQPVE